MTGGSMGDLASADDRTDERRRLDLLSLVAEAGGTLLPHRSPEAKAGYDFGLPGSVAPSDLRYLAERDYLDERFFDRVSICPKCSSHFLNVREVCPSCRSAHYSEEPLLHHFRCGYVGRVSEFTAADGSGKRICPKCSTQLKYLGTDHDQLGRTFLCLECGTSFQDPPASAMCLSCGTETLASDLSTLEISSYSLTSLGTAAIRRSSLFEQGNEALFLAGATIYRPTIMREILDYEARRCKRFKSLFSLLLLQFRTDPAHAASDDAEVDILRQLRARFRAADAIGQLATGLYAVCLPETGLKGAQVVRAFAATLGTAAAPIETSIAELSSPADLAQLLAGYGLG
ncbi:MAG TPA: hypothetical protein VKS60_14080 [Stellaceae bacterium]|nr:hypothetical protein [Stellaceae bacterium]